jgi:predicted MFS family arabinose efflux permease
MGENKKGLNFNDWKKLILACGIMTGTQFVGNSPAPLQQEIMSHMGISETEFNLYFSVKGSAGVMSNILLTFLIQSLGISTMLILSAFCCSLGQALTWYGLVYANH